MNSPTTHLRIFRMRVWKQISRDSGERVEWFMQKY